MTEQPSPEQPTDEELQEIAGIGANPDIPPRPELPVGIPLIAGAIASADGGVNGLNPYIVLRITVNEDDTLTYVLEDRETLEQTSYLVTITEVG